MAIGQIPVFGRLDEFNPDNESITAYLERVERSTSLPTRYQMIKR